MTRVAIIGTGDLAYGIAHLFQNNNSDSSGHFLEVTKPSIIEPKTDFFHDTGVNVAGFNDALDRADVVVFAVPSYALGDLISSYESQLKNKILVDATNSYVSGEDLNSLLAGRVDMRWVKGLNDIGAIDVLLKKPSNKKKTASKMCSPDLDALTVVKQFAEESLGCDIKIVPYEKYSEISTHQNEIGKEWRDATITMVVIFLLCQVYNIVRHPVAKGYPWYSFPCFCMNKAISWTAITGFATAQLGGIFARMSNAIHRDTLRDKPKWMRRLLDMRKHLGLISLWFLAVHIFMSCLMFGPNYYGRFFVDPKDPLSRMNAQGESSFMCGSFGAALYIILGVASLPSVAELMTSKQWNFIFGPVAWSALVFGTFHVICQGIGITWDKKENWPWGMPPITLMSTLIPMTVLALKVIQIVFVHAMDCRHKNHYKRNSGLKKKMDPSDSEDTPDSVEGGAAEHEVP